jgi:hypothetical protein
MLCRRHHRAVHEEGFRVERQADGELLFRRPNGCEIPHVPPSSRLAVDPAAFIREQNAKNGIALHARTPLPSWRGEPLDLIYAIDALYPRAR